MAYIERSEEEQYRLDVLEKFTGGMSLLGSRIFFSKEYAYATNGHIMVRCKCTSAETDQEVEKFEKLFSNKDGAKVTVTVPDMAWIEPDEMSDHITTTVDVGIFENGNLILWSSLSVDQRESALVRLNLGLLRPLREFKCDLYIHGKIDPVYFECDEFTGTVMPMRRDI